MKIKDPLLRSILNYLWFLFKSVLIMVAIIWVVAEVCKACFPIR